jgi:hypothetical protein
VTGYGNSAARKAQAIRAHARRGVWRRVTAWLGLNPAAVRADARAALWEHGARGEAVTEALLAPLTAVGWVVRHDVRLRGRRWNVDTVLVSPCGTAVVVLDTKTWHRGRTTALVRGRVCCGVEDRHEQVVKVAGYARQIAGALALPGVRVLPLLVVHGSPVAGGYLTVRVEGVADPVFVLSPPYLVPTLANAPKARDRRRAAMVAGRVDAVLRPYGNGV